MLYSQPRIETLPKQLLICKMGCHTILSKSIISNKNCLFTPTSDIKPGTKSQESMTKVLCSSEKLVVVWGNQTVEVQANRSTKPNVGLLTIALVLLPLLNSSLKIISTFCEATSQ